MRARASLIMVSALVHPLVVAASALAGDNGEGLAGETDDKVVTFFSLGVVVFFVAFIILASLIQGKLDKRKEEKKAAALRQRIGW